MEEFPERGTSQPEPEDLPAEPEGAAADQAPEAPTGAVAAEPEPVAKAPEQISTEPAPEAVRPEAEAEYPAELAQPVEVEQPDEAAQPAEVEQPAARTAEAPVAESAPAAPAETPRPQPAKVPVAPPKPAGPRLTDLKAGMVMEGTVTRIEKYGAFVSLGLADRRDGLIHISELSPHRIRRVEDVVKPGDSLRARVVSVDMERGRIALSLNDVNSQMGSYSEAQSGSNEPVLTAMELAFQQAYGERREREGRQLDRAERDNVGARKKREHVELMRRLQSSGS